MEQPQTQTKNCPHCDASNATHYTFDNGFELLKCNVCGTLYVAEQPLAATIEEAHRQGVHQGENILDSNTLYSPWKAKKYKSILDDLIFDLNGHDLSVLDIGCGHGEFLEALRGFLGSNAKLVGSEPNVKKQESARSRDLNVSFLDVSQLDKSFDMISFLNVWSHVPNPRAFLDLVAGRLKSGGRILLQTGDVAGLSPEDQFDKLSLPDHLHFGSERTVCEAVADAGFKVIRVKKYNVIPTNKATWIKEAVKLLSPGHVSQLRLVNKVRRVGPTDMYVLAEKID